MNRACLIVLVALAAVGATPALAATSSFGTGPARACFEAAERGDGGITALNECDAALGGQDLSRTDRGATLVNRGVVYLHRRAGAEALADFDRALALLPNAAEAHVNRGAALILLARWDEAIAAIDRGLELGTPDPHEAHFNRAIAYEGRGDLRAARADFARAAELAPEWPLPQAELARFSVVVPAQ